MQLEEIYKEFKILGEHKEPVTTSNLGATIRNGYGINAPKMRSFAKKIGTNHSLALKLWKENCHDAKVLATLIADVKQVDENLMEKWVKDLYSWDICDGVIQELFAYTPFAYKKAIEWSKRKPEYEKRAGFAIMAKLAISDKKQDDKEFEKFFPYIIEGSYDERNFVKKAVNWAIRQIGKRSKYLNRKAVALAKQIQKLDSKSARWIAADAIRELTNEKTLQRIKRK